MDSEMTMSELLEERRFPVAALALVADIDDSTAWNIVRGKSRPRGTTAIRMAEGLGIGYSRMRRILAATWEAGQGARDGKGRPADAASAAPPKCSSHPHVATTGPPAAATSRGRCPGSA